MCYVERSRFIYVFCIYLLVSNTISMLDDVGVI